jgi:2,4-diketo-3-deoxy-L-fuconate hydrolase
MKLVRFGPKGGEKPGLVDSDGRLRDLSGVVDDIAGATLTPAGLDRVRRVPATSLPVVSGKPRLGACVGHVPKLIGIGLNYSDHAREVGRELPEEPAFFLKATSSIAGPDDPIVLPAGSEKSDWETELAIVIGTPAKNVGKADAMAHVAGFCTAGDISERQYQWKSGPTYGKSFDTFGPLGPYLLTADEVADPYSLRVTTDVDGKREQNGSTRDLIFKVPEVIAYLSRFFTLSTGDVILTGTPAGVGSGHKPQVFLKAGQTIVLSVEGLGTQTHKIEAAG